MVKIISDNSYKTHAFIDDIEISNKATSIQFEQNAGEVPIFTFETIGLPDIEIDNADVRFRFTPETVTDAIKVLRRSLIADKELYNAFVASIVSALKEIPAGTGLYDVAEAVADRIIGREE